MSERNVTFDMIVHAVAAVGGVSRLEIMSARRGSNATARLRHVSWWLARELTPLPYETLGRLSGNRDHSTVMHGVCAVDAERGANETFRIEVDALKGTLVALERQSLLRMAAIPDPLATARRVLAAPEREAVRVPVIEIVALCRLVAETFGEEPEPTEPASTATQEIDHAA